MKFSQPFPGGKEENRELKQNATTACANTARARELRELQQAQ
jgi:hypothetical protein